MKFTAGVFATLTGAALAASTPYNAPMAPTGTPCPTESASSPVTGGTTPYAPASSAPGIEEIPSTSGTSPSYEMAPTKTPCPTSMPGYNSGSPATGSSTPGYGSTGSGSDMETPDESVTVDPSPEAISGTNVTTVDGATSGAEGNTTVSVAADEKSGVGSANAEEGGAALTQAAVGSSLGLSVSGRQAVTYTDEAGVQYYQDASGQWWYYPSPTPGAVTDAEKVTPGAEIGLGNLTASSSGQSSVVAGASDSGAAAAGNGMNGVLAAAAASPGAPNAVGLAF